MNSLLSWIEDADDTTAWTTTNSYTLLNAEANAVGGVINSRFDVAKARHGVDHAP